MQTTPKHNDDNDAIHEDDDTPQKPFVPFSPRGSMAYMARSTSTSSTELLYPSRPIRRCIPHNVCVSPVCAPERPRGYHLIGSHMNTDHDHQILIECTDHTAHNGPGLFFHVDDADTGHESMAASHGWIKWSVRQDDKGDVLVVLLFLPSCLPRENMYCGVSL